MAPRILVAFFAAVLAATLPAAEDAWTRISRFEFNAAADELGATREPSTREQRLAHAVALLNRQPRTPGTIDAAAGRLAEIVTEKSSDDVGRWARFFNARIAQLHRQPADAVRASAIFRELIAEDVSHPAAQRALLKLAVLLVYDPDVEPDRARGFRAAEELGAQLADDAGRAELRLMLGRAAIFFRLPAEVCIAHLQAALESGVATPFLRAATLFALGEFARESGRRDLALTSYRRFLAENQRDQRVMLVREHLATLEQTTAAR